jgi:S-adenosylmethionine decarboxylase
LCELSGCDPNILTDVEGVEEILKAAALKANATVVTTAFHRFQPHGVSGVVVIEESHLSIHTWPEAGYAAMDFYTCGAHTNPWAACEYAAQMLRARSMRTTEVKRGILARKSEFTHVVTTDNEARVLTRRKRSA